MRQSALRTIDFFGLTSSSHLHSCISFDFIGGKMMAVRADLLKANFTFENPSNCPLKNYEGKEIDLLAVVPSQMHFILDNLKRMPLIRNVIIGGAPIPNNLRNRIEDSGINAYETYGMTETASHIALRKVTGEPLPFRMLPGIDFRIDSKQRLVILLEEASEIKAEVGKAKKIEIITNDVAKETEDGGFLICGRYDNVIISGGMKIFPEEVEEIIENALGTEVLISSKKDEKWGQKLILITELTSSSISDEEMIALCKKLLPKHCVPKEIIRDRIPRTQNEKKKRIKFL